MARKYWIISAVVLTLAVAGAGIWHLAHEDDDIIAPAAAATGAGFAITPHDMTLGNPRAKAVMIEYAAPICPHCAHFNATVMPLLKKNYIATGKMLYVFRVFPLQAADGAAEKLARCMSKDKYFPFMDQLFANQKDWDPEYGITDVRGAMVAQAAKQGMSEERFNACLNDPKPDAGINKVAQDGVDRYHLDHTPTVILNGEVQKEATWEALKPSIDKVLAN
jgi:protein-disulfide isomerase